MTATPPKLSEAQFQRWVVDCAAGFGWAWWHVPAPMRATAKGFIGAKEAAGLCDLILIHDDPPRLIFAEIKGPKGKLSVAQQTFLQLATGVASRAVDAPLADDGHVGASIVAAYVWEPGLEDAIEAILKSRVLL